MVTGSFIQLSQGFILACHPLSANADWMVGGPSKLDRPFNSICHLFANRCWNWHDKLLHRPPFDTRRWLVWLAIDIREILPSNETLWDAESSSFLRFLFDGIIMSFCLSVGVLFSEKWRTKPHPSVLKCLLIFAS